MPVGSEVDLFCRALAEEGQREAEKILSQARSEAAGLLAEAQQHAEKTFEVQRHAAGYQAQAEARKLVDAAELEARKRIITFRETVIRDVLNELAQRLNAFRQSSAYADFLLGGVQEGIEALAGREFIVELASAERDAMAAGITDFARKHGWHVEVIGSPVVDGGVRVYSHDRRRLYDNSLAARQKRCEDEIRARIWRKILGAQDAENE